MVVIKRRLHHEANFSAVHDSLMTAAGPLELDWGPTSLPPNSLQKLNRLFREEDVEKTGKLPRPHARKFLIRAGRKNIPFAMQQRIFGTRFHWKPKRLMDILKDSQCDINVLAPDHPFEILCVAIEAGDYPLAFKLLNPTIAAFHDSHLLYITGKHGFTKLVKTLLDEYHLVRAYRLACHLKTEDPIADNPLVAAAEYGHYDIVKMLLKKNVDPSADEDFSVRLASENGYLNIVKLLLKDSRVDPGARDNYAIQMACENGKVDVVSFLLKDERVDPSADDNYALHIAAQNGRTEVIKILLKDPRVDPASNSYFVFRAVCEHGFDQTLKVLLADPRVDPSANNNRGLLVACDRGHTPLVKRLLKDDRIDPGANNSRALLIACDRGNVDIAKLLLADERVDPNCGALRIACKRGFLPIVEAIMSLPNVSIPEPILADACSSGHTEIVKYLSEDPRVPYSRRALIVAAHKGNVETVKALFQSDRITNYLQDNKAIRVAARDGHTDIVDFFLKEPRIDPFPNLKRNPALSALYSGRLDTLRLLLKDARLTQAPISFKPDKLTFDESLVEVLRAVRPYTTGSCMNINKPLWGSVLHLVCSRGLLQAAKELITHWEGCRLFMHLEDCEGNLPIEMRGFSACQAMQLTMHYYAHHLFLLTQLHAYVPRELVRIFCIFFAQTGVATVTGPQRSPSWTWLSLNTNTFLSS